MTAAEDRCRRAIHCLYIAVEKPVADDINTKVKACLDEKNAEIERLNKVVTELHQQSPCNPTVQGDEQ